jgi:hypothetical protein
MKLNQKGAAYLVVIILIVVVVALGVGAYLYGQSQNNNGTTNNTGTKVSEPATPKTEITVQGQNATVNIKPSVDNVISGVVTITVTKAPDETKMVFFVIAGQGIKETGPNLGIDSEGSDGWSRLVDTAKYKNGLYEIAGLPMTSGDDSPLGKASAQVTIKN